MKIVRCRVQENYFICDNSYIYLSHIQEISNIHIETASEVLDINYRERVIKKVTIQNGQNETVELDTDTLVMASGGMAFDQSADGLLAGN